MKRKAQRGCLTVTLDLTHSRMVKALAKLKRASIAETVRDAIAQHRLAFMCRPTAGANTRKDDDGEETKGLVAGAAGEAQATVATGSAV